MLHFVCYKWKPEHNGMAHRYRVTYTAEFVNVLASGINKHVKQDHRVICVTDDPEGVQCETFPLWDDHADVPNPSGIHLPGCYRRLRIFDPATQEAMGIPEGDRIISVDVDSVIVSDLTALFERDEPFVAFKGRGSMHPTVYNGSMYMFSARTLEHLWSKFDPVHSPKIVRAARFFGSDQGWLSYNMAGINRRDAPGWDKTNGVLSYSSDIGGTRAKLPKGARIVFFNGKLKPWDENAQKHSPWIAQHWRL